MISLLIFHVVLLNLLVCTETCVFLLTEMWPLKDTDYPLFERVQLQDPSARIFLMDKPQQSVGDIFDKNASDELSLVSATVASVWKPVDPPSDTVSETPAVDTTEVPIKISHEVHLDFVYFRCL